MGIQIIPQPVSVRSMDGMFTGSGLPEIEINGSFLSEAALLKEQLRGDFPGMTGTAGNGVIRCRENRGITRDEGYRLAVRPGYIDLEASSAAGAYHGFQSVRQLLLSGFSGEGLRIPCADIEDYPRFPWRGCMLDTARHFYLVHFIKKIIDILSLHHFSIFHWHLTDDQGWRLPVPEFPALTAVGSKRRDLHSIKGREFGGYYTEEDIREVVAHARARHVEVVPEVELPGHASAILASYPEFGCTGGPYAVEDRHGIFEDVLCAGNDRVFELAGTVFDTLVRLFPSRYVHIGGDEVLFNRWAACPRCRGRMEELGFTKYPQLQGWMTARFARMLGDRGRSAVGWDEVLEETEQAGLPPDLVVMSWRGQEGGFKASSRGHRVVMSPLTGGCYLDYQHTDDPEEPGQIGICTLAQLYHMDPITPEMTAAQASCVLGGQCNLWSELIYADRIAEYMLFPRICAASEAFWSPREQGSRGQRDLDSFSARLEVHWKRLDRFGVLQYRGPLE